MPEQILRYLEPDCAVIGDGEDTLSAGCSAGSNGTDSLDDLPGIASRAATAAFRPNPCRPCQIAGCAVPDYRRWLDLAYRSRMSTVPLQTKLGCQFQCVYCTYRKIEGETYRLFDPEGWPSSTAACSSGMSDIEFVDNVFNAPAEHALGVCEAFIRVRGARPPAEPRTEPRRFHRRTAHAHGTGGFRRDRADRGERFRPGAAGLGKGFTSREVYQQPTSFRGRPALRLDLHAGRAGGNGETVRETLRFAEEAHPARRRGLLQCRDPHLPGNRAGGHCPHSRGCCAGRRRTCWSRSSIFRPGWIPAWIRRQVQARSGQQHELHERRHLQLSLSAAGEQDRTPARAPAPAVAAYCRDQERAPVRGNGCMRTARTGNGSITG